MLLKSQAGGGEGGNEGGWEEGGEGAREKRGRGMEEEGGREGGWEEGREGGVEAEEQVRSKNKRFYQPHTHSTREQITCTCTYSINNQCHDPSTGMLSKHQHMLT